MGSFKAIALFLVVITTLYGCSRTEKNDPPGLPYFNTPDFTPTWPDKNSAAYQQMHTIPAFTFTDQYGKSISNGTVTGKIYVADFFFTRCGSICPKMTDNMSVVARTFMHNDTVMILSHSVTPELDNVSVLKAYAEHKKIINPNWHLLTGDKTAIYNIARRGYFADEAIGYDKDESQFLHTENFILVDKHGRIRGVYNGTIMFEVENLIRHIKILEQEG
ncbi:electron transporter [Mucilaginibacter sp. PPCGB 2223]|nr:electron transporter [Mucilaginibacter sp. PPCGB 2223]